jgi:hypothetical protein
MAHSKLYNQAAAMLERADARIARALVVGQPHERDAYGRLWWSRDNRRQRWAAVDFLARIMADHAMDTDSAVLAAERLVARAREADDISGLAKACAARVQIRSAAWAEAYGKYFAEWDKEFIIK